MEEQEKESFLKEAINLSKPELAVRAAEFALQESQAETPETAQQGQVIYSKVRTMFPNFEFNQNSFQVYLSNAVRDPDSRINCMGRRQGYFLSAKVVQPDSEEAEEETPLPICQVDRQRKQREIRLYPLLGNWLAERGYQWADTSLSKRLGVWGNPDLTGVLITPCLNQLNVEVATIEAKTSDNQWERLIFEAVSHRRYSNRSYFAFAVPDEMVTKIRPEMRYYGEIYQVGILAIVLENSVFNELMGGNGTTAIGVEDAEIREIFSAPYTQVHPAWQRKFLDELGIKDVRDLCNWGREIAEE